MWVYIEVRFRYRLDIWMIYICVDTEVGALEVDCVDIDVDVDDTDVDVGIDRG